MLAFERLEYWDFSWNRRLVLAPAEMRSGNGREEIKGWVEGDQGDVRGFFSCPLLLAPNLTFLYAMPFSLSSF